MTKSDRSTFKIERRNQANVKSTSAAGRAFQTLTTRSLKTLPSAWNRSFLR